jgi:predicted ATPase
MSHGEGFLEVLRSRFDSPGLYCLTWAELVQNWRAHLEGAAAIPPPRARLTCLRTPVTSW